MPIVTLVNENKTIEVAQNENLRLALKNAGISPYVGVKNILNCFGNGLCSSCAVEILENKGASPRKEDEVSTLISETPFYARKIEKHHRLSCQVNVVGDMQVKTHPKIEIDKDATKRMMTKSVISSGFILLLGFLFVVMFFDMIKII